MSVELVNTTYDEVKDAFIFTYRDEKGKDWFDVCKHPIGTENLDAAVQELRKKVKFYIEDNKRLNSELEGYLASKPR